GTVRIPPGVLVPLENPTIAGYSRDFHRSGNIAALGAARRCVTVQRFLQRAAVAMFLSCRQVEIVIWHLEVVLLLDARAVAEPFANNVNRKTVGKLRLPGCA